MEGGRLVLDGKPREFLHMDVWTSEALATAGGRETLQR